MAGDNNQLMFSSGVGPAASSPNLVSNIGLSTSVAGNALTINLTDGAGNAPAQTSIPPVQIGFRNATETTGTYNARTVSAALSITVPSGTTIGTSSGVATYIYVYALDNAGTVELAVSLSGAFDEGAVQTTTAISGGSSSTTLYSTSARSNVPVRLIGRIAVSEATAGTWASAPTEVSGLPYRASKQFVVGAAQTSSGTASGTSFGPFTVTPTITFVALRTGLYRLYGSFVLANGSTGTNTYLRINPTAGSPTVIFSQEGEFDTNGVTGLAGNRWQMTIYTVCQLTAGTSYTFQLETKAIGGGTVTLYSNIPTNGHALIAEEI